MRQIVAAIVFAVVMVLTGSAHAIPKTLVVTEGEVLFFPVETFANFSGNGFSVLVGAGVGGAANSKTIFLTWGLTGKCS